MAHQYNYSSQANSRLRQGGAVLILMAFILGLGAAAYLLKAYNADAAKAKQDEKTYQALGAAKQALLAWAVSHPNTPGLMPYPDRNGDGNYDDTSDCYASNVNFAPSFTIGRLPLFKSDPNCVNAKNTVNTGLAGDFRDGTGERLWYEVSKNLLHDYKDNGGNPNGTSPIINPSIVTTPSNPWFVVRDRNGAVISNRVAAVIIAPGAPSGTQDRSSGIANANQYLDKIVMVGGTPYQNYGYQDFPAVIPIQEFIIGDDFRMVAKNDPTYRNQTIEPYYYNDKLVYITIDDLMYALEKRVGQEAASQLAKYYLVSSTIPASRFYPYAAPLGGINNVCSENNLSGFLPIQPSSASCTSSQACTLSFPMTQVKFTLVATEIYGSRTGACSRSGNACTCTGAGSCTKATPPSRTFTCTADGSCISSGTSPSGSFTFMYTPKIPDVTVAAGACSGSNGNVVCTDVGDFSSPASNCSHPKPGLADLPKWFTDNLWQNYMYYQVSDDCIYSNAGCAIGKLTVGVKNNNHALVVSAGTSLGAQSRPSNLIADYLDSQENTNGDNVFDAIGTRKSNTYNDQMFIVAP